MSNVYVYFTFIYTNVRLFPSVLMGVYKIMFVSTRFIVFIYNMRAYLDWIIYIGVAKYIFLKRLISGGKQLGKGNFQFYKIY